MSFYKKIIRTTLISIALLTTLSCRVQRKVQASAQLATDRMLFVPLTAARVYKDIALKIYHVDSLKDDDLVLMNDVQLSFVDEKDTLDLNCGTVKFHFAAKKLIYDEFAFPKWDLRKVADTMKCTIRFTYHTAAQTSLKLLQAAYHADKNGIAPLKTE